MSDGRRRLRRYCSGVQLALVGWGLLGCGSPERPGSAAATAAIVAGADDAGDAAVVGVGLRRVRCGAPLAVHCTATLVAPRIVLTAAHCVGAPALADNLEVLFASDAASPAAVVRRVEEIQVHPDYHAEGDEADLALLILTENAPALPVALNTEPLDASWVGRRVRLVGFGQSHPSDAPPGKKRSGTAAISEVGSSQFRIIPAPSLSCHGDSGGPVLGPDRSGGEVLLGVTAKGDPGCAAYGLNVRVDAFSRDFILSWISRIAGAAPPPPRLDSGAPLCSAPCQKDADCPDGLSCRVGPTRDGLAPRCVLPGLLAGELYAVCTSDEQCSAGCMRLRADQSADACRCYRSCVDSAPAVLPEPAHGCNFSRIPASPASVSAGLALSSSWVLLFFYSLIRRRRNAACLP